MFRVTPCASVPAHPTRGMVVSAKLVVRLQGAISAVAFGFTSVQLAFPALSVSSLNHRCWFALCHVPVLHIFTLNVVATTHVEKTGKLIFVFHTASLMSCLFVAAAVTGHVSGKSESFLRHASQSI